jgi:hypothetical protein
MVIFAQCYQALSALGVLWLCCQGDLLLDITSAEQSCAQHMPSGPHSQQLV